LLPFSLFFFELCHLKHKTRLANSNDNVPLALVYPKYVDYFARDKTCIINTTGRQKRSASFTETILHSALAGVSTNSCIKTDAMAIVTISKVMLRLWMSL
jgi:hypothetical protein